VVQVVDECLVFIQPRVERAFEFRSNTQSLANPFRFLVCSDFVTEPEGILSRTAGGVRCRVLS